MIPTPAKAEACINSFFTREFLGERIPHNYNSEILSLDDESIIIIYEDKTECEDMDRGGNGYTNGLGGGYGGGFGNGLGNGNGRGAGHHPLRESF